MKGAPTELRCVYMKNSAMVHRDGYPLSGDGYVHKYVFENRTITYEGRRVAACKKNARGMGERRMGELGNFANTAVFEHDGKVYSVFESKPAVNIETRKVTDFGNPLCNFMCVHPAVDEDGTMVMFNCMKNKLNIMTMRKDESKAELMDTINLPGDYYCHDFVCTRKHMIFPLYEITMDIMGAAFGYKSIVESVKFKYGDTKSCMKLLKYERSTGRSTLIDVTEIRQPVFHICGREDEEGVIMMNMFAVPRNFQLTDLETKYDYNSTCYTVQLRGDMVILSKNDIRGDMPTYDDETGRMVYVNEDTLIKLDEKGSKVRKFEGCVLEEAQIAGEKILQIAHTVDGDTKKDRLYIIDYETLEIESEYEMPIEVIHGFHGHLSWK